MAAADGTSVSGRVGGDGGGLGKGSSGDRSFLVGGDGALGLGKPGGDVGDIGGGTGGRVGHFSIF